MLQDYDTFEFASAEYIILETSVDLRIIAQAVNSPGYVKKIWITNQVIANFFPTPIKPTAYTLISHPTDVSRLKHWFNAGSNFKIYQVEGRFVSDRSYRK